MQINTDLSKKLAVNCGELPWLASPQKGVERVMLERDGDEVARATSLVRYAPKSSFSRHQHDLGKEFLVLEGEDRRPQDDSLTLRIYRSCVTNSECADTR